MNKMPSKHTGERRGPGSHAFDEYPSAGAPACGYGTDAELEGFSASGQPSKLNAKGGSGFEGSKESNAALAEWAGIKAGASSSITEEGTVGGIFKPGAVNVGVPRAQKLAPHSD